MQPTDASTPPPSPAPPPPTPAPTPAPADEAAVATTPNIGGWLWVTALWLPVMVVRTISEASAAREAVSALDRMGEMLETDRLAGAGDDMGLYRILLYVVLAAFIWALVLFWNRSRLAPRWIVGTLGLQLLVGFIGVGILGGMGGDEIADRAVKAQLPVVVAALVLIPYFLRSRRVRETFVR